jgi:transcriptional regulator with XRE-family HTH domain
LTIEYLDLPELLKLYQERRNLSQQQLAKQINVLPSLLSMWTKGRRRPNRRYLDSIAAALALNWSEKQNLFAALQGDNQVAEKLALHEMVSLYLDRRELKESEIMGKLGVNQDKLREWRRGTAIPMDKDLEKMIALFGFSEEEAHKLREAKPRLSFSPEILGFILLGSPAVSKEQIKELIQKGGAEITA